MMTDEQLNLIYFQFAHCSSEGHILGDEKIIKSLDELLFLWKIQHTYYVKLKFFTVISQMCYHKIYILLYYLFKKFNILKRKKTPTLFSPGAINTRKSTGIFKHFSDAVANNHRAPRLVQPKNRFIGGESKHFFSITYVSKIFRFRDIQLFCFPIHRSMSFLAFAKKVFAL